jgi:hypothetical protein
MWPLRRDRETPSPPTAKINALRSRGLSRGLGLAVYALVTTLASSLVQSSITAVGHLHRKQVIGFNMSFIVTEYECNNPVVSSLKDSIKYPSPFPCSLLNKDK